jgi:hypothetical protein
MGSNEISVCQPAEAKFDFSDLKLICLPSLSFSLSIFSPPPPMKVPDSLNSLDKGWMCSLLAVGFPEACEILLASLFKSG